MRITDLYTKYAQPPMLIQHQLRVASVGALILKSINIVDDDVIKALLTHDLGNVVRLKFGIFGNEDYGKLGIEYYIQKQKEFISKYGSIDHEVTTKILKEAGLNAKIIDIVESINWENIVEAVNSSDMVLKVVNYSDMRVGPLGVLSVLMRIDEVNKRKTSWPEYQLIRREVKVLESQIFANSNIVPEDISDEAILPIMNELKYWEI